MQRRCRIFFTFLALMALLPSWSQAEGGLGVPCAGEEIRVTHRLEKGINLWRWQDPAHDVDLAILESGDPPLDASFRATLPKALCLLRTLPEVYGRALARKEGHPTSVQPVHQARVIRMLKLDKGVDYPGVSKKGPAPARLRRGAVLADYSDGVLTFFPAIFKRSFYASPLFWASNLVHEWTHKEQARQGLLRSEVLSYLELHADLHQQYFLESLPQEVIRQQGREYGLQLDNARERNADTLRMMGTRWFRPGLSTLERICLLEAYLLEERFGQHGYRRGEYCRTPALARLERPTEPFTPPPREERIDLPAMHEGPLSPSDPPLHLEGLEGDGGDILALPRAGREKGKAEKRLSGEGL